MFLQNLPGTQFSRYERHSVRRPQNHWRAANVSDYLSGYTKEADPLNVSGPLPDDANANTPSTGDDPPIGPTILRAPRASSSYGPTRSDAPSPRQPPPRSCQGPPGRAGKNADDPVVGRERRCAEQSARRLRSPRSYGLAIARRRGEGCIPYLL